MGQVERRLILIRHSQPEMATGVPASQWALSKEGRRRCQLLARRLAGYDLDLIVSSQEPKAMETGQIVAGSLHLSFETAPGLHEHERGVVTSIGSREEFQGQVKRLFEHPGELVFGNETADQAHLRFSTALSALLQRQSNSNLAVVSHGTVISLFISRAAGLDPVPFWQGLGLPAYAVLSLPGFDLQEVVPQIGTAPEPSSDFRPPCPNSRKEV